MDDLSTLLHDAVSDVEPADRLAEIRAAVDPTPRRFGWYAAGGAALAVAAAVTAFSIVSSPGRERADDVGPATPAPSAVESETPGLIPTPVYYVGDTPFGERLYREFQRRAGGVGGWRAMTGPADDPDYRTFWPEDSIASVEVRDGVINVTIADASLHDRPASMTAAQAELAIQQLVYTVQAGEGARLPVQLRLGANPIDQVFGVPTSEPISNAAQLDVLAQMSVSDPREGLEVVDQFIARGAAISYEGNVLWELRAQDGTVVREGNATAGMDDHPLPWETESIDVSDLPPGTYTFEARTEARKPFTDTRTVVVQ